MPQNSSMLLQQQQIMLFSIMSTIMSASYSHIFKKSWDFFFFKNISRKVLAGALRMIWAHGSCENSISFNYLSEEDLDYCSWPIFPPRTERPAQYGNQREIAFAVEGGQILVYEYEQVLCVRTAQTSLWTSCLCITSSKLPFLILKIVLLNLQGC